MTNTVRLEQAIKILSDHVEGDLKTSGDLILAQNLIQSALDIEKANEDRVLNYAVKLATAKEHLRDAVWMFNTVPNFSDGIRKSYDLSRDINAFLRG